MVVPALKKKLTSPPSDSAYSSYIRCQISAYTNNFDYSDKFVEKGYFLSKTKKVDIAIECRIFELRSVPNFSLYGQF